VAKKNYFSYPGPPQSHNFVHPNWPCHFFEGVVCLPFVVAAAVVVTKLVWCLPGFLFAASDPPRQVGG